MSEIPFDLNMDLPPVTPFVDGELVVLDVDIPKKQIPERSDVSIDVFDSVDELVATELGISLAGSISACMQRAVLAQNAAAALVLEAGYLLLKVKSECEHGEFINLLKAHGVPSQRASELMMTSKFYARLEPEKRKLVFSMSKTKLMALAVADQEVVQDLLENPGEDLTLSVRALRQRLRDMENVESKQIKHFQAELDHRDALIDKLKSRDNRKYNFQPKTHIVREECLVYQAECELALNSLQSLFDESLTDLFETEKDMRVEQVYLTANVVLARATQLISRLQNQAEKYGFDLPSEISSKHTLTNDEAERWLLDYQAIERKAIAETAFREQRRRDEAPKGPGRPRASK